MGRKHLTKRQKLFLAAYNPFFGKMLGWRQDSINAEFTRTYGVAALLKFGKTIGDALAYLSERYGEADAQHLVGFAGLMNGCRFCGIGHNLTANVTIFQESGTLFPVDELEIPDLQLRPDEEIMEVFRNRLSNTRWSKLLTLIERMEELRLGSPRTESDDDTYLGLALDLWGWNNECTIETGFNINPKDVPSFAKFNGDRALYERYRAARAANHTG
ncbi:MAG: hypothetical protein AAGF12_13535 [Myxococcota bacterium]